jgi:uncharacterized protein YecE (DUF72 family)
MRLHVGTSGYSYAEWKGNFYPEGMPAAKMLAFYAGHFDTVEINATFYRMPQPSMFEKWNAQVPESFLFALKAPQRITHFKKFVDVDSDVAYFCDVTTTLGPRLGPLLFQLPPFLRKDAEKLRAFLATIPGTPRVAMEFRHDSWCDDEVYAILRERNVAICLSDTDEVTDPAALVVPTATWGYLRLRRTEYTPALLAEWRQRIEAQPWDEAFVFFKHEDEGKGPKFAREFLGA